MGMTTLGVSLIANAAAGIEDGPINHAEVMEMGQRVSKEFSQLLTKILARL
jgi:purine-nucleoside phosphorylase